MISSGYRDGFGLKVHSLCTLRPYPPEECAEGGTFEPLPPRELRALSSGASLERLKTGEAMMVGPREHARRVIVLLSGRATVYEPGPHGHRLTVSGAEASAVVGVTVVMADGASVVDY